MMIGVAVIAVVLGVGAETWRLTRFRQQYLLNADIHALLEQNCLLNQRLLKTSAASSDRISEMRSDLSRFSTGETQSATTTKLNQLLILMQNYAELLNRDNAGWRDRAAKYAENAAYHAALKEKYRRAADRPWLSVEPDGPEPKMAD